MQVESRETQQKVIVVAMLAKQNAPRGAALPNTTRGGGPPGISRVRSQCITHLFKKQKTSSTPRLTHKTLASERKVNTQNIAEYQEHAGKSQEIIKMQDKVKVFVFLH